MNRRISIRSYRKPDTLYSPLDLIVCEGETEVDYLCELARNLRIHAHICKGDGTDPKSIVNSAKRKSKNVGGIYSVATVPLERKKGYGTAMVTHLLTEAKNQGYPTATLYATKEGKPLHERLGFTACNRIKKYISRCKQ